MTLLGRKIAITGAGRGLGKALAIVAADRGAIPILLGRSPDHLTAAREAIGERVNLFPDAFRCDLADFASIADAAQRIARQHPDLDVLVHNASQWSSGALDDQSDDSIAAVIDSTVTGMIALTRHLLPLLRARPRADIHIVVSMSGLQYARFVGSSLPFRAAKAAQDGFSQGLVEELKGSNIRITSIYPGLIDDVSPLDSAWETAREIGDGLSNKDVVDAILYALAAPPNVALRQIVIERTKSEFLA
ncbi:SDR family oxidoreductase [Microvirga arabica]|uniref:SDR family oxidoreductase n=1 Tax=Microvirga arabica TaxID=1128671 RepID=UPI0019393D6F|nr:SDR family oxidoreductase [Microvirga arabica]MBM1172541.1 SDR family oxidoreductase [Microvirga arabica]